MKESVWERSLRVLSFVWIKGVSFWHPNQFNVHMCMPSACMLLTWNRGKKTQRMDNYSALLSRADASRPKIIFPDWNPHCAWDSSMGKSPHLFHPSARAREHSKNPSHLNLPTRSHHRDLIRKLHFTWARQSGFGHVEFEIPRKCRASGIMQTERHEPTTIFTQLRKFRHTRLLKVASARAFVRDKKSDEMETTMELMNPPTLGV